MISFSDLFPFSLQKIQEFSTRYFNPYFLQLMFLPKQKKASSLVKSSKQNFQFIHALNFHNLISISFHNLLSL